MTPPDLPDSALALDAIDIRQRWRDRHTGDRFTVLSTYRDHPTNPSFLIDYDPPAAGWHSRGRSVVTFGFFRAYCDRIDDDA